MRFGKVLRFGSDANGHQPRRVQRAELERDDRSEPGVRVVSAPDRDPQRAPDEVQLGVRFLTKSKVKGGPPSGGPSMVRPTLLSEWEQDVTGVAVANPVTVAGHALRCRRRPLDARVGRAQSTPTPSTSLIPTGFSRGQAIRVGLTSTGIRHGNTGDVLTRGWTASLMAYRMADACPFQRGAGP